MLRKNLLPRTLSDIGAVTFLLVMVQVIYWFELFLVLPQHYEGGNNYLYYFHCTLGTWFMFNIVGNYVITFLQDTSIRGRFLASGEVKPNWRLCEVCETLVPPRSWHCPVCDVCILKRDHHCNFTACCVGHDNHRYFMMFLLHLSAATFYASYFNVIFLWNCTTFSFVGALKLIFPMAILVLGGDTSVLQMYRMFCVIALIGMIAAVSLFVYHSINIANGQVMHERVKRITDFDSGRAANLRHVFGQRWYLVWVSPFVRSELPCDGIDWDSVKKSTTKAK
ncbi:protein-cysteine S-palmitoyltransferase activity [Nesidiocoris tenuis]|uniref:Palmitoyltransferase n=1 Tax=Nesidiocoris tenuis TaxID=355587 RepID=A0ABN7B4K9_9HEMI|nr:protein-cysteine S-palmitoyltransferase activity [Nesidiocoris tenuis]